MQSPNYRPILIIGGLILCLFLAAPVSAILLNVRYDYTLRTVTIGSSILGLVSGVLGSFAVLRKESLMGDTLSHAALPGVALAFLFFGKSLGWLLIGAGITGWLSVIFIGAVTRTTRIKKDTAMGISLSVSFGVGLALLAYIQERGEANQAGIDKFIFGQAAAIVQKDVNLIGSVAVIIFIIVGLFWKEFKLITFDHEFARTNGVPVRFLDILLSTLIVVAIVLGLQLAGVILMAGMLIAPAVAARQWTKSLEQMVILAGIFGSFAGAMGAIISAADADLPTGPFIIVSATGIVIVSLALAPERGLLWAWFKQQKDRRAFTTQLVLEDLYHLAERHHDMKYAVPEGMLVGLRGKIVHSALSRLVEQGLIQSKSGKWMLTDHGLYYAQNSQYVDEQKNTTSPSASFLTLKEQSK